MGRHAENANDSIQGQWNDPVAILFNQGKLAYGYGCRKHPNVNCLDCPEEGPKDGILTDKNGCTATDNDLKGHTAWRDHPQGTGFHPKTS
jgi:hypothetical protein